MLFIDLSGFACRSSFTYALEMVSILKILFASILIFSGTGCANKVDPASGLEQGKTACKGVHTTGSAIFSKIAPTGEFTPKSRVTFTWAAADGTLIDSRTYSFLVHDQCVRDQSLTVGTSAVIDIYVQCPLAPAARDKLLTQASMPYAYFFPDFKSPSCKDLTYDF